MGRPTTCSEQLRIGRPLGDQHEDAGSEARARAVRRPPRAPGSRRVASSPPSAAAPEAPAATTGSPPVPAAQLPHRVERPVVFDRDIRVDRSEHGVERARATPRRSAGRPSPCRTDRSSVVGRPSRAEICRHAAAVGSTHDDRRPLATVTRVVPNSATARKQSADAARNEDRRRAEGRLPLRFGFVHQPRVAEHDQSRHFVGVARHRRVRDDAPSACARIGAIARTASS